MRKKSLSYSWPMEANQTKWNEKKKQKILCIKTSGFSINTKTCQLKMRLAQDDLSSTSQGATH